MDASRRSGWAIGAPLIVLFAAIASAQPPPSNLDLGRAQAAVQSAFGFLFALPSDTAGAAMGAWVLDSGATTSTPEPGGRWRIVATKLTDTGQGLKLEEMVGEPGTSPRQLAAAMAAMQQLEARISRSEAEASVEVVVTLNASPATPIDRDAAPQADAGVEGARFSRLVRGHWTRVEDRDLEVTVERWVPATLLVQFASPSSRGIQSVVVSARGSEEMIERLVKEARWGALAQLVQ